MVKYYYTATSVKLNYENYTGEFFNSPVGETRCWGIYSSRKKAIVDVQNNPLLYSGFCSGHYTHVVIEKQEFNKLISIDHKPTWLKIEVTKKHDKEEFKAILLDKKPEGTESIVAYGVG